MAIDFKECGIQDLEVLAEISRKTFCEAFEKDNDPEDFQQYIETAFAKETLAKELSRSDSFFYFVLQNNRIVGYLKLNVGAAQSEYKDQEGMELERIYVVSTHQGKGLGTLIVDQVFSVAKEKNKQYVWLGVWEHNQKAIRFYKRYGFQKVGTHPYFIGNDKQNDWLMHKRL